MSVILANSPLSLSHVPKKKDLQFGEVGQALEHVWCQAADAVVGQIPERGPESHKNEQ